MKSTGIVRRVDELGRVVIPIELRNKFDIKISLFSFVMAAIFAIVITLYIIIGFKVMEKENMSVFGFGNIF